MITKKVPNFFKLMFYFNPISFLSISQESQVADCVEEENHPECSCDAKQRQLQKSTQQKRNDFNEYR